MVTLNLWVTLWAWVNILFPNNFYPMVLAFIDSCLELGGCKKFSISSIATTSISWHSSVKDFTLPHSFEIFLVLAWTHSFVFLVQCVIHSYYFSFWCSNCPRFGQWEPLQARYCVCPFVLCPHLWSGKTAALMTVGVLLLLDPFNW